MNVCPCELLYAILYLVMNMNYKVVKIPNLIGYQEALDIQLKIFDLVYNNELDGVLLILEHKPVLTMGIRTDNENLLVSEEYLTNMGVELYKTDRGGDITFHGPGQIVAYPIVRIKDFKLRLSEYMHNLEKVIIETCSSYGVKAHSRPEFPGVWVQDSKICAIGVKAKRFITYHGLAFNISTDKKYFNLINPCGITEYPVSCLHEFVKTPNIEEVKDIVIEKFNKVFGVTFKPSTLDDIIK